MIVRVLTARVHERNAGQFNELARRKLDRLHGQPGLVYAKLARRLDDDGREEVVLFEEWRTPADLWRWTEGHLAIPRFLPGTEQLVEALVITHYEALDMTALEAELSTIEGWAAAAAGGASPDIGSPDVSGTDASSG